MLKLFRILVPTDFSEYSDKSLERALDIAREALQRHRFFLLHICPREEHFYSGELYYF